MLNWMSTLLPPWASRIVISLLVIGCTYAVGYVARYLVLSRLRQIASRTAGLWDDVLASELSRRVPFWALLLGLYMASGYWMLPAQIADVFQKTLFVVVAMSVTLLVAAVAATVTREYGHTVAGDLPVTSLMQNVVRLLVVLVGGLTIMNGLGLSIAPMLTALGVGGLAVALALQDTLANLFAGIYVTLAGQIRVGHYIRLDSGQEGYLIDIAWRSARLRMLPNNIVLVPNAKLAQAIVTNHDLPDKEMAVLVNVGVDYDSDLRHVERVTCEVARDVMLTTQGGVESFEPFIRYHTFGDSSIDFTVILRAREFVDQYLVKHEFVKRLHVRYNDEGITIPFPIRTVVARAAVPGTSGSVAA